MHNSKLTHQYSHEELSHMGLTYHSRQRAIYNWIPKINSISHRGGRNNSLPCFYISFV